MYYNRINMQRWITTSHEKKLLIIITVVLFLFTAMVLSITQNGWGMYVRLALSFWEGRLSMDPNYIDTNHLQDLSYYNGRLYSPLGVFPALIFMPLVFFWGTSLNLQIIMLALTAANF